MAKRNRKQEIVKHTDDVARQVGSSFSMVDLLPPASPRRMLVLIAYGDAADAFYPIVKAVDDLVPKHKPR